MVECVFCHDSYRFARKKVIIAKGGEIQDTKTLNLSRNIVSLQVSVDVSRFSPCVINFSGNKNICFGLKKVVAQSRARTNFGFVARFSSNSRLVAQQICSGPSKSTNQRAAFLQPATNVFVAGQVDHAR